MRVLPDFVRQQLAGGRLNDVQGAVFGAAGRGAVSDVLAIVRREPPVERDGAVGGHLVGVHQPPVFSMQAFAHQQHRLVLGALAPDIKEVRPGDLRRPDRANRKQLGQPIVDAVAPRQRIQQAAGVGHLIANISLRVRTVGILQPAVGIGNLVPMNGIDDRVHLGLGRPGRRGGRGAELSSAHASAAIRERQATIQSKREPPGIKHLTESDVHRRQGLGYQNSNRAVLSNSARMLIWMPAVQATRLQPRPATLLSSSMAEHPAVNRGVVGSSPT